GRFHVAPHAHHPSHRVGPCRPRRSAVKSAPVDTKLRRPAWLLVVAACSLARSELVDVTRLDPSIRVQMPYATSVNFTGMRLYPVERCLLRRAVAERLVRVQRRLRVEGSGLLLWDCYRPFAVQQRLWALVPDARYVAEPVVKAGRRIDGSKHNRGAAV